MRQWSRAADTLADLLHTHRSHPSGLVGLAAAATATASVTDCRHQELFCVAAQICGGTQPPITEVSEQEEAGLQPRSSSRGRNS